MPRSLIDAILARAAGAAVVALLWLPAASPAIAQDDNSALQQRIERLESDVQILQRQVYLGAHSQGSQPAAGAPNQAMPPGAAASLEVRVSQLEEQMQSLTGRIEELGHNVAMVQSQLEKLSKDVDLRLSRLEQGQGPSTGPAAAGTGPGAGAPQNLTPGQQPQSTAVVPPSEGQVPAKPSGHVVGQGQVLPLGTPKQQYDYAQALLYQRNYDQASAAFKAFVNTHPEDPLTGAAEYWLGETYYVRGSYPEAASAFAQSYEKFPKGAKAADALLKLGMSLVRMNKKSEACTVFESLSSKYPKAPANVTQLAARERQRAGCS